MNLLRHRMFLPYYLRANSLYIKYYNSCDFSPNAALHKRITREGECAFILSAMQILWNHYSVPRYSSDRRVRRVWMIAELVSAHAGRIIVSDCSRKNLLFADPKWFGRLVFTRSPRLAFAGLKSPPVLSWSAACQGSTSGRIKKHGTNGRDASYWVEVISSMPPGIHWRG